MFDPFYTLVYRHADFVIFAFTGASLALVSILTVYIEQGKIAKVEA